MAAHPNPFVAGQRWLSTAEPELGLGTVLRLEGRNVQVLFAAANVMRVYAQGSAPLVRAEFRVGDAVAVGGAPMTIVAVTERGGVLHYRGGDGEIPEGALDDVQNVSKASDRLAAARVDRADRFDLRVEALQRRAATRRDPGHGVLSARIALIPHQLRVAEIASERRPPRLLFADEVGLGKTIEACLVVARAVASGRAGRVLVLVPEALVYQWFVELLRRFNLSFAVYDEERAEAIAQAQDGRNPFLDDQLVLTDLRFALARPERTAQLEAAGWDLLVVDEAHHLQWTPEHASEEYALVERLASRAPGVLLLTATPEQLGRAGHFARLRLLDPARFPDLATYQAEATRYVALSAHAEALLAREPLSTATRDDLHRLFADVDDADALALLDRDDDDARQALLRRLIDRHGTGRVMFRNRRAVVGGFPARIAHVDVLSAEDADPVWRERLLEEFHGDIAQPPTAPPLQYADDPRLAWLIALLDAHADAKFLLICRSQPKLHALEEALRLRSGVAVARFHEGLGIVQRDRNAAHFAAADGARLLLCTEIGSEGRNFQFAQHLVLWDLPLDPDLLEQRIGRLDRIGQRGDIHVHACVLADSAQHALAQWYDQGLDAFRASPEDGRELLKRFGTRVVDVAMACAHGANDAAARLHALISETHDTHEQLAQDIARGRDRLLELITRHTPGAEALHDSLQAADNAAADDETFVLRLFEHFGVTVDELGPSSYVLDPEMLTTEAFSGLDQPRQVTFDRRQALSREDMIFLRLDHPLVGNALDLLLSSESGNAAFMLDDVLPARTALLEAVFVLECVAPPALAVDRFLPPLPLRVVVDTRLADRSDYAPSRAAVERAALRPVDPTRQRKMLATLVPPMFTGAEKLAQRHAQAEIDRATARADTVLGDEIARLRALARVNPAVHPEEIAAAESELAQLRERLPQARVRLDSLRFIASPDFLSVRL